MFEFLSLLNGCLMFCFLIICCWCIERDIFDLTPSYEFFLLSFHSQQFLGICCINNGDICKTVLHFTLSLCYFVLGSNPGPIHALPWTYFRNPAYMFSIIYVFYYFSCVYCTGDSRKRVWAHGLAYPSGTVLSRKISALQSALCSESRTARAV